MQPLCLHTVERERERETFSGKISQLQPSERSEPQPLYFPLSLLHKNISDVREVKRLRVQALRVGGENSNTKGCELLEDQRYSNKD